MKTHKRTQLSFVVQRTQKLLFLILGSAILFLGSLYLFGLNTVALRGYALTKEAQKALQIHQELERVEARIIQVETKDFLTQETNSAYMVYNDQRDFLVYKEGYTAQKN